MHSPQILHIIQQMRQMQQMRLSLQQQEQLLLQALQAEIWMVHTQILKLKQVRLVQQKLLMAQLNKDISQLI